VIVPRENELIGELAKKLVVTAAWVPTEKRKRQIATLRQRAAEERDKESFIAGISAGRDALPSNIELKHLNLPLSIDRKTGLIFF
jgi:hypothetical protein